MHSFHFSLNFFSKKARSFIQLTRCLSATPLPRAHVETRTDSQLNLITEAATSAQHSLCQFYNGRNPLELISDEEINLLTGQIYSIQITIDPFSTQLIKTFLVWPSTLCMLKQIISNKQVLWGPKEKRQSINYWSHSFSLSPSEWRWKLGTSTCFYVPCDQGLRSLKSSNVAEILPCRNGHKSILSLNKQLSENQQAITIF